MNRLQETLPSAEEASLAKRCSQALSAILETRADTQTLAISTPKGGVHSVDIPVSALRLLVEVLTELGEGNSVRLVPVHAELTSQDAADLLNVSRPTLIRLLNEGAIPYHRTGNRRKVKFADLRAYQQQLEHDRLAALSELSALDQELGLGYE